LSLRIAPAAGIEFGVHAQAGLHGARRRPQRPRGRAPGCPTAILPPTEPTPWPNASAHVDNPTVDVESHQAESLAGDLM
jgi:hypothetical protein